MNDNKSLLALTDDTVFAQEEISHCDIAAAIQIVFCC